MVVGNRSRDGDGGTEQGATNEMSSASSTGESSIEAKIVSDGEPRSNVSSPPSSATTESFDAPDDPVVTQEAFKSLNQLDASEKLLALAASVAARTTATTAQPTTAVTDAGHQGAPKETTTSTEVNYQKVTSYSSLEGALLGTPIPSTRPKPESKVAETRTRVSRPSPTKVRSTAPRQKGSNSGLRRGKWTAEEETYVARVIQDFNSGFLDAPAGTTLRTYLSEKLKCDPMRITKKFTGEACIGKRVFHPAARTANNIEAIDKAQAELDDLECRWRRRMEMQQRESAKKAAASAAVAQVAVGNVDSQRSSSTVETGNRHVTQTATWLDRAKLALNNTQGGEADAHDQPADIQSHMQEVQRLIREGPVIQQASADLPQILDDEAVTERPKRMRTTEGDAEALVGFLRTVRASVDSRPPPTTD